VLADLIGEIFRVFAAEPSLMVNTSALATNPGVIPFAFIILAFIK